MQKRRHATGVKDKKMEQIRNILKEQEIEADDRMITAIGEQFDKGFTVLFHHQVLTDNKAVYLIFSRESDNKTYRAFKYIQNNSLIRKADMDLSKINFSNDMKENIVALIARYVLDDESYDFFEVTQHYNAGKSGSAVFRAVFGTEQCGTSNQRVFKINLVSEIEQEHNNFKKYLYGSRPESFPVVEYKPENRAYEYAMLTYESVRGFSANDEVSLLSEYIRKMLSNHPTVAAIDNLSEKLKEVFRGDLYALYQKLISSSETMSYRQIHDFKLPAIESFDKCLILDESIKEKVRNNPDYITMGEIKKMANETFLADKIQNALDNLGKNFSEYKIIEIRKQSGRVSLKLLNAEYNRIDIESHDDPNMPLTIGNKIAFLSFSEPQKEREAFYKQIALKISSLGIEEFQGYCNSSCIEQAVNQMLDKHDRCCTVLAHGDLNPFNILLISDTNTGNMKFKIIDYQQFRQDDLFFDLAKLETELLIQYFADNPQFSFAEIKSLAERIFLCDTTLPIPFKFFMNFRNILQAVAEKPQVYVMSEAGWYRNYLTDIAVYALAYQKYHNNEERKRQTALVLALENMSIINRFQEYDFKELRQRISYLLKDASVPVEIINKLKKDYEFWRNKVADLLMSLAIVEKEIHDLELQYQSVFYDYLIKKRKREFALRKIELMQKKLEFIDQKNVCFIQPEECPLPEGKKKTLKPDNSDSVILTFCQNQYRITPRDNRTTDFFFRNDFWIGASSSFSMPIKVFSCKTKFFITDSGKKIFSLKFRPFEKSEIFMLILPELKSEIKEYHRNYKKMNAQIEAYEKAGVWRSEDIEAFKEIYRKMAKIYSPNAYGMGYPEDWDEKKKENYKTVWLQMQRCKEAGDLESLKRVFELNYDLALGDNEKFIQELLEKGDSQFFSEQIEKLKQHFDEIGKEIDRLRKTEVYGYKKYLSEENEKNALMQRNEAELNKLQQKIEDENRGLEDMLANHHRPR